MHAGPKLMRLRHRHWILSCRCANTIENDPWNVVLLLWPRAPTLSSPLQTTMRRDTDMASIQSYMQLQEFAALYSTVLVSKAEASDLEDPGAD